MRCTMGGWESVGSIKGRVSTWEAAHILRPTFEMYYGRVGECGTQALSGQRPATDVVCQPAKVNHKHNICLG